jgi:cell division protein FtsB
LVKAVQEQQAQIEVLMAENEALRIQAAKLNEIEAKLDALLDNKHSTYNDTNEK